MEKGQKIPEDWIEVAPGIYAPDENANKRIREDYEIIRHQLRARRVRSLLDELMDKGR